MSKIERDSMTATDSSGKVIRAPKDNASGEAANFKWWDMEDGKIAHAVASTIKFMQRHQASRMEQLTVSTRLYGNSTAYNLLGAAFTRSSSVNSNPMSQRLCFNLIQSVTDTLVAKMAKNKVIPTYVTNGGVWKYQKKAKQLTKFSQGLSYQLGLHEKCIDAFRDGAVWGDGFTHVFRKDDKVCIERVLPHELIVDLVETMIEEPRQIHRVKIMDRQVALEQFPELEESILLVSPANYQDIGGQGTAADLITVTESWHLRSSETAKDGKKVICIGDGALVEPYERDYFPFPHFRYSRKMLGWHSQGVPERLQTIQGEINRSMMLKQKALWMQGAFKVLIENGSKIVAQHVNNDIGTLVYYTGTAPQYVTPPATNPELQQWIDSLIQKGFMQEGVSELSASGEKPIGVNSGKAMRTMTDIEDNRFRFVSQMMEQFVLENHRQAIDVVKDIYADQKCFEVVFPATNFLETVDWKDIDLDKDAYVLKSYPTSGLADDIAGRLSDVQELMQAGMISPRTGRRLMDMPDVEMNDSLSNAKEDLIHKVLEEIIYDQEYQPPRPFMDMQLAKQLVLEYYNYAWYMKAPEKVLELLQQFNDQVNDMMGVASAAMQPLPAPGAAPTSSPTPMANPTAPPTSNLIPNVNQEGAAQ